MVPSPRKEVNSGSRRPHTKSRNGCGQCKKRRVKCDLKAPVCANCRKRDTFCDYQLLQLPVGQYPASAHHSEHVSSRNTITVGVRPSGGFQSAARLRSPWQPQFPPIQDARSAELMRNFVERTSLEFDLVIDSHPLWRRDAVQASEQFPFLRHSLMALSGLHICHMSTLGPHDYYYHLACQHSVRASQLFRNEISNVTNLNWRAILTFLISTVVFNLDVSFLALAMGDSDRSITPASMVSVLRAPGLLSKQNIAQLVSGPLAETLLRRRNRFVIPVDERVLYAIQRLAAFCETEMRFESNIPIYKHAVHSLEEWAFKISCQPRSWQDLVGWPIAVSDEYLDILRGGDELARVIFVYWCAVIHRAPERYYLVEVMNMAEQIATAGLDPGWDHLLDWPRKELQAGRGVLFGWMV